MAWKIRFYSGLNKGVEVPLAEGRLVIGSDPLLADLVVVDPGIAAIHLVLDVDTQGVRLLEWAEHNSPVEGGEPLSEGSTLKPFASQSCGPLLWAYCAKDRAFNEQQSFSVPTRENQLVRSRLKWIGRVMAVGSLLLLMSVMVLLGESWFTAENGAGTESRLIALRAFLREQHMPHVEVGIAQEGGSLPISGYIEENHQRLILQRYLERSGLVFRMGVRSLEEIRKDADFILHKLGHENVQSINAERPGWIRLSGAHVLEVESRRHLEELLKADVPGLLGVEASNPLIDSPIKRLGKMLKDFGLETVLVYREEGEGIELSGELDEHQYKRFLDLQQQFSDKFGGYPMLKLIDNKRLAEVRKLNFVIRSVSLGRVPYLVLGDNHKYTVGALISGGGRVVSISRDAVVIRQGTQQFVISLGEGVSDGGGG